MKGAFLPAAIAAALVAPAPPAPPALTAPTAPARVSAQRMVQAHVVLRAQADTTAAGTPMAVERVLRATSNGTQRELLGLLARRRAQGHVSRVDPLWIFNGIGLTATPSVLRELARRPEVREIRPDATIATPVVAGSATTRATPAAGSPEPNLALVNAPELWGLGYSGQGTVVANLDTGVDAGHPDLAGRWRGGRNSWYDPNGEHPAVPTDRNGHGTATMGVMVGGDSGGTAIGMAPGARWIAAKIFNDRGRATSTGIHRAMQWLLDPDGDPATDDAPDVVLNAWTQSARGCSLDFQLDLAHLRAAGILPVFAAGNYGPAPGTVLSPAGNPEAFAVGAIDNAGAVDASSSRGPSPCAGTVAPRLVAPGVGVHSADLYGGYTDVSGTSLAAPHVAGGLALLLSAVPTLPAGRQAAALEGSAVDLGATGPDNTFGYGRLDVLGAYHLAAAVP